MKISRLRRTLAVFLSALMLTLCAPMSAFTALAASTVSVADIISGSVTQLNVGDTVDFDTQNVSYGDTSFSSVYFYFDDLSISGHTKDHSDKSTSWEFCGNVVEYVYSGGNTMEIGATRGSYVADVYWAVDDIVTQQGYLFVLLRSDKDTTLGGSSTGNTINLNANGGRLSGADTATTNANGTFDSLPAEPTREGYTFGGWYTDATKGTQVTTNTQLDDGATIYAQWLDDDLQSAVTYLESAKLTAVVGDATGTMYVFSGIPELSQAEIDAGFKYVYTMVPDPDPENQASESNSSIKFGDMNRSSYTLPSDYVLDVPENLQIELNEVTVVCFIKINTNKMTSGAYHVFAEKDFAAGKAAAPAGFTITFDPNDGTLPEGTESTATTTDGKLPAGTLASLTPTREGFVFGGWYVWSTSANDEVLVDDNYTFTDDNIRVNEESVTISAQWYKAYNNIYVSDQSSLLYGYSTGTPSTIGDDAPLFYLDTNGFAKATLTDINWYCVDSGVTFDPNDATKCNDTTVSTDKDYYLVCTVSVGTTAYRFGDQLTAQAEYGSEPTIHSKDSTTATISWQITPYEVITKLSNISINPDITSPSYKLEPGDAPAEFTGTATYTTKSGKTGELNLAVVKWVKEAEHLYWDDAVDTIEDGSSYVPMLAFAFPGQYYLPARENFYIDGMTNLETDSDSYSFDVENSFEVIVLNAKAITASAASSVLDKPIEYLGDVTLTPVSGDTTGTRFEFGNIPSISKEESDAGYKYIYIVYPDDDPESAAEYFNEVENGQINVKDTFYAMPLSLAKDLTESQITVSQSSSVYIAKVNTNYVYVTEKDYYYTFAVKAFAVTPSASTEYTITLKYQDDKTADTTATTENGKLTSLPTPTRTGYTFKGWFDAETGGEEVTTATVFEQNTTIYAQWTKNVVYPALPKVTATAGENSVSLKWTAVDGAASYRVFYRVNGTKIWTTKNTTTTSATISDLTGGTKYDFLVLAYDGTNWSKYTSSDIINATPKTAAPAAPAKPVFTATAGDKSVSLKWNAVSGATSYRVFYRVNGTEKWATKNTTGTALTVTDLTNGTKYDLLVRAYNGKAWSAYTDADIKTATPKAAVGPAAPAISSITPYENSAVVRWTASAGATSYRVYYRISGTTKWSYRNTTQKAMVLWDLTGGKKYDFLVCAYNGKAWSTYTAKDIKNAVPVAGTPKPTITSATPGKNSVTVKWTAADGAKSYRVFYRVKGTSKWSYVNTTRTQAAISGLTGGKTYEILVRSYSANGWSSYSPKDYAEAEING